MINLAEKRLCSGCSACMNICPKNAITMRENTEGFLLPKINETLCIQCGKCQNACPVLKPDAPNPFKNSRLYAVWAEESIRRKSSSGGMFLLLAEHILQEGGTVYGAAYSENWNVQHQRVDNPDNLYPLSGSKYVQSDVGYTYQMVQTDLKAGRKVLYTGTPCQIAGLYKYLENSPADLLTVDLLCHGVPSPKVFKKYLTEFWGDKKITNINFRYKKIYGWSTPMHIEFEDGTCYDAPCDTDVYYRHFLPCLGLRESCANCIWSSNGRYADISIGDLWGIDRFDKKLNDRQGTSAVLVNSQKGDFYFNNVKKNMALVRAVPMQELFPGNPTVLHPFRAHSGRKHFFSCLDILPLAKLVDHSLDHHYDVGIAGLWYGLNYGSILTYYALYKVINQLGYDAIFLSKPDSLWAEKYNSPTTIASKFIHSRCNVTNQKHTEEEWINLNSNCDTFMVGSDVIWNYEICGKESGGFFFLDFVEKRKKKIAYASSFGSGYNAPEDIRERTEYYLNRFDYVSVRETEGIEICRNKFGIDAAQVLDAVFLCDPKEFHKLAEESRVTDTEEFIASYILGADDKKRDAILTISEHFKLPYRIFVNPNRPDIGKSRLGLDVVNSIEVVDWLYYVKNCQFFIADSFHGVCFAIIFRKPFICYLNRNEPSKCRFTNLLGLCGLESRIIYTDENFDEKLSILEKEIDYEKVFLMLKPHIDFSKSWLKSALETPKKDKFGLENRFDELYLKCLKENNQLKEQIEKLGGSTNYQDSTDGYIKKIKAYYHQHGLNSTIKKLYKELKGSK